MSAGNLFVVAAPSGAGKTTLCDLLLQAQDKVEAILAHGEHP